MYINHEHTGILGNMIKFASTSAPPTARTPDVAKIALLYAIILIIMVVGQLFSFEKFIPLIESFSLPGGYGTATLVASVVVIAEIFALPFLLRMRLSPAMCVVSMACGWIVAVGWLKLTIWANVTANSLDNIGILGASIDLPVGWWAVLFSLALLVLSVWTAWGMWPVKKSRK